MTEIEFAAFLVSRVCHDLVGPLGAVVNGLEVLEDERDAAMRADALKIVTSSAEQALARLQFLRIAFGAAGSAGAAARMAQGCGQRARSGLLRFCRNRAGHRPAFCDPGIQGRDPVRRHGSGRHALAALLGLVRVAPEVRGGGILTGVDDRAADGARAREEIEQEIPVAIADGTLQIRQVF